MELSVADFRDLLCEDRTGPCADGVDVEPSVDPLVGTNVIIRTVTMHYTGHVVDVDDRWIHLADAAWIANSGRWSQALATGSLSEVEPYPDGAVIRIGVGAVVEVAPWGLTLPRDLK